jgi:hypothetical protein
LLCFRFSVFSFRLTNVRGGQEADARHWVRAARRRGTACRVQPQQFQRKDAEVQRRKAGPAVGAARRAACSRSSFSMKNTRSVRVAHSPCQGGFDDDKPYTNSFVTGRIVIEQHRVFSSNAGLHLTSHAAWSCLKSRLGAEPASGGISRLKSQASHRAHLASMRRGG